ncbi:MAG: FapA family protein [Fibrobacterota bacterium]
MPDDLSRLTLPAIDLTISSDRLSATLSIIPTSGQTANLTPETILTLLSEKNVKFGIDEAKLRSLVHKFNMTKDRIENEEVAHGKYPKPGKKGDLRLMVSALTEKEPVEQLLKESPEPHITDILRISNRVKRVNAGEIVAHRNPPKKGTPGEDIFGKTIDSTEYQDSEDTVGANITVIDNGESFRSNITGVVVFFDNKLDVIHGDFNARFQVTITPDRMEAHADFLPAGEGGKPLDTTLLTSVIHDRNVVFGLNQPLIQETANKVNIDKIPALNILIACGTPAVHGINGRIEYFFNTEGKLKPKVMEDGSVNFKDISLIETVAESQELARIHHPTQGIPGHDVSGNEITAKDGQPITAPAGANVGVHPSNPDVLIALKGGNVRLNGKLIEVSEGFTIGGDIDFSTGNVDYKRSLTIKGDVKSGFSVTVGGDLDIGGLIEDSVIKTEGNVLVRGGFMGNGKGEINASGSVNVGFIRNQTIKSRGNVVVAREAMNAKIFARNTVSVHGKTLSVVGGKVSARNEIEGYVFGNDQGTRTELEIGTDFTLVEEKFKTEDKIRELNDNKKKVAENISKFDKIKKIKKALPPKQEFLFKKLSALAGKIDSQMSALEKRKEMIELKLKEIGKARIVVKDRMHPGCIIKIGDRHFAVQNTVLGPKSVMLVDGEIKFI